MNYQELEKKCADLGLVCPLMSFEKYFKLLKEWNEKINLTAIKDEEDVINKHFWDCIIPLKSKEIKGVWADVGSGAGFPGIVWKIMRPDLNLVLIEPTNKRCLFLNEVIKQLNLQKIQVVNERAEDYVKEKREYFDGVSARAVSKLSILVELSAPLIKVGGYFLPLKGKMALEELAEAKKAISLLGLKLLKTQEDDLGSNNTRINFLFQKFKETPIKFPRNYGQIKKKPL